MTNPARIDAWYTPDCGHLHLSEGGNVPSKCPDGHTPDPDPLRPVETDLERVEWLVDLPAPDRPSASDVLFVIALAVIVGILVAWAVR